MLRRVPRRDHAGRQGGLAEAIAEAWAHGAVPVAAAAAWSPGFSTADMAAGRSSPSGWPGRGARRLLSQPALLRQMSTVGPGLAAESSLETFEPAWRRSWCRAAGCQPGEPSRSGRDGDRHADSGWRGAGSDHARQQTPPALRVHVITTRSPGEDARELFDDVVLHSLDRSSRWGLGALSRFAGLVQRNGSGWSIPTATARRTSPTGSGPAPSALDRRGPRPSRADRKLPGHAARRPGASPRGRPLFRREREAGAIRGAFDQGAGPSVRTATQWYRRAARAGPAPRRVHHRASGEVVSGRSSSSSRSRSPPAFETATRVSMSF